MSDDGRPEGFVPHHPLTRCWECPLYELDAFVPSTPSTNGLLFVGEKPGNHELRQGRFLAGPSGKLTARAIMASGQVATLRGAGITNAVACKPRGDQVPAKALRACAPRLRGEVERADRVLALGAVGATALLGRPVTLRDDALATDRDQWFGRPVVIGPNPASVLRDVSAWPDIVQAAKRVATVRVTWEPPSPPVVPADVIELARLIRTQRQGRPWVVDIEATRAPKWWKTRPARLRCVGIRQAGGGRSIVVPEQLCPDPVVKRLLSGLLTEDGGVPFNESYDRPALAFHGIQLRTVRDPMLGGVSLDERPGGKNLESMGRRYLGAHSWKPDKGKDGAWYDTASAEELYVYNGIDLAVTDEVDAYLLRELDANGWRLHDFLLESSITLSECTERGVLLDPDELKRLIAETQAKVEGVNQLLSGVNSKSGPQVAAALAELDVELPLSAKGNPVANKQVLAAITEGRAGELTARILESRQSRDLLSQFLTKLRGLDTLDGRVHASFWLTGEGGAKTGRTSSSNPNLQNQPDEVRSMYVAAEGKVFVAADYKQAELRVLGVESYLSTGDETLLVMLRSAADPMGAMAEAIFGAGWTKVQRQLAKTVVHGTNYGRSPGGIAQGLRIEESVAQRVQLGYFNAYPGVQRWQQAIEAKVRAGEPLTTPFGRTRRLPAVEGWMGRKEVQEMLRSAWSTLPQSIASDIDLTAANLLYASGWPPSLLVHDSILMEVDEDVVDDAKEVLQAATFAAARRYTDLVDFPVDIKVGKRWSDV